MEYNKVSFTGAGRVAGALCREMFKTGFCIQQIVSLNESNGRLLAESCKAQWSPELIFPASTEIIIVAVPDQVLKTVLNSIKCDKQTLVVHTAGSSGLDVFPDTIKRKGVFYPLQTFSKQREIEFTNLPVFIEASDIPGDRTLNKISETIGCKVYSIDSGHRKMLHLAAVFVNNFTNHMLTTGMEIAARSGFSFDVFEPLIKETISKAMDNGPENSQTGPAVRNDINIIEKHLDLLSYSPESQSIYREITRSIMKYYNKSNK